MSHHPLTDELMPAAVNLAKAHIALLKLVNEWRAARQAVLAEPTPDVRTSDSFRAALDRLASAEDALFNLKGVSP